MNYEEFLEFDAFEAQLKQLYIFNNENNAVYI